MITTVMSAGEDTILIICVLFLEHGIIIIIIWAVECAGVSGSWHPLAA